MWGLRRGLFATGLYSYTSICTGLVYPAYDSAICCGTSQQGVLVRVALATKMADAQVEYKRVDLQSYEAQSFKYKFSFPSIYRRLKATQNRSVTSERKFAAKAGSRNGAENPPMALLFLAS